MSPAALGIIECMPTMDELDSELGWKNSARPLTAWPLENAPGSDGIPGPDQTL